MLIALAILAVVVVVLVGVVILWRSSSDGGSPDQDSGTDHLIDVAPPGPGGGG